LQALKDPSFISQLIDSVPGVAQGDLDVDVIHLSICPLLCRDSACTDLFVDLSLARSQDILNQLTGGGGEEAPKKADDKGKKDDKGGAGAGGAGKS
jgi:hypothetical protein